MMQESMYITTYRTVSDEPTRKGRTLICEVCNKPYTDNISKDAHSIICARCSMGMADAYTSTSRAVTIEPVELFKAMTTKKLKQYRKELGLTQDALAGRLGITDRQYRDIEKGKYIPSVKVLRKFEKRITQGIGLRG